MKRLTPWLLALSTLLLLSVAPARLSGPGAAEVSDAVTELDVERARRLLSEVRVESAAIALERARLSLYVGDCDSASATLATLTGVKEAASLTELSRNCARATAGSVIVEDARLGLWIRLQDEGDRVLLPVLSEVAARARNVIEKDLGVVMPRPLRIDLVRDLFSLSAVSGLPLTAAETTGTVAVARWGRVNMISPRAAPGGFPWEDTLAHEITHLAISRATRDHAPLWLQEGLAKREEIRWRDARPFDADPPPDVVARQALLSGESVGVDRLGPSIAMLPNADAASIAFAEVSSFVQWWIDQSGLPALHLLLADLKGFDSPDANAALRSVSGYDLPAWILRWQHHLQDLPGPSPRSATANEDALRGLAELVGERSPADGRDRARRLRTSDLLFARGAPGLAADRLRRALANGPRDASVRWRLGRSLIAQGKLEEGAPLFASRDPLDFPHPGWFALEGRHRRVGGDPRAEESFGLALSLDPYLEDAACEGSFRVPDASGRLAEAASPASPARRALCEAARKIPSD